MGPKFLAAALGALLVAGKAQAGDSGAATLAAGESVSARIDGVYRDIRICNDVGSTGTLTAIVNEREPIRLAPGHCHHDQGNRIHLENDSSGVVRSIYLVTGVHQS